MQVSRRPQQTAGGEYGLVDPAPPLIAHVIHHLVVGGLENGLVNLINRIPPDRYRHTIVCMEDFSDFRFRIERSDVEVYAMRKHENSAASILLRLYKLFRRIKPSIVHSRNLSGLDSALPATLAGVGIRIHGEHGRDVDDLDGGNRKLQWLRRLHTPFVHQYIALSKDLEHYLVDKVQVNRKSVAQIYNGVDTEVFSPSPNTRAPLPDTQFAGESQIVIGTVGRIQPVKDQMTLVEGFITLLNNHPHYRDLVRLAVVGDGPLLDDLRQRVEEAGVDDVTWLAGPRDDVAAMLRGFDVFVLPSLAEGISNTILEAMATGLPIVATDVGGNGELLEAGETGLLVPSANPAAMAEALATYVQNVEMRREHGANGRRRAEQLFSLDRMVRQYISIYDRYTQAASIA